MYPNPNPAHKVYSRYRVLKLIATRSFRIRILHDSVEGASLISLSFRINKWLREERKLHKYTDLGKRLAVLKLEKKFYKN